MHKLSCQIIKYSVTIVLFFGFSPVKAQLKLNCCGINQIIPTFKPDTNFDDKLYEVLLKKDILSPIKQSDAAFEIRISGSSINGLTIVQLKCSQNVISVKRYKVVVVSREIADAREDYLDYIELTRESRFATSLVKIDDVSQHYEGFDWNKFFRDLIDNDLFDIPGGKDYTNAVLTQKPKAARSGEGVVFIEIKYKNQYRNLKYWGEYVFENTGLPIIKKNRNICMALFNLFPRR